MKQKALSPLDAIIIKTIAYSLETRMPITAEKLKKEIQRSSFFKNSEDIKIFNSINKCVDYLKELKEIRKEDKRAAINILEKLQVDFQEEE